MKIGRVWVTIDHVVFAKYDFPRLALRIRYSLANNPNSSSNFMALSYQSGNLRASDQNKILTKGGEKVGVILVVDHLRVLI